MAPLRPSVSTDSAPQQLKPLEQTPPQTDAQYITKDTLCALEDELRAGPSMAALRRFSDNLAALPTDSWHAKLRPVMHELAYNLESFNPAFTAVLLKVQSSIGHSDYERRDAALKCLIQPLAGEYGMHNGQPQGRTHRELFSLFYQDMLKEPLEAVLSQDARPPTAAELFEQMSRDILSGGGHADPIEQASYAMGYNLAIEFLADFEKTWMLDSIKQLNARAMAPQGQGLTEWEFLEVHAEGEKEHAAIGHDAVLYFVPAAHEPVLRQAMQDHDRDFAVFYNRMADMLEA